MIFPAEEVVTFTFDNVDLSFATEDSFTDTAISSKDQCKIDNEEKVNLFILKNTKGSFLRCDRFDFATTDEPYEISKNGYLH